MTVRRICYGAAADVPGGSARNVYDKIFYKNCHATLSLNAATIAETADPSGLLTFALEAALGGTTTNGGGNNRFVAPAGLTFDSTTKNVANSQILTAGSAQAVWVKLALAAGAAGSNTTWAPTLAGAT